MGKSMDGVRKSRVQDVAPSLISCVKLGKLLKKDDHTSWLAGNSPCLPTLSWSNR